MLNFLDKYEYKFVFILSLCLFIFLFIQISFFNIPIEKDNLTHGIWFYLKNIFYSLILALFLGFLILGPFLLLVLRFIGHIADYNNLHYYFEDISNNEITQLPAVIFAFILLIAFLVFSTLFLTYFFNFLLLDYNTGPNFLNIFEHPIVLFISYLIMFYIILGISHLMNVNAWAFFVSLIGIIVLLPNIFNTLFNENINQVDPIINLLVYVKIFFGLLFSIFPWFFDRSYKRLTLEKLSS